MGGHHTGDAGMANPCRAKNLETSPDNSRDYHRNYSKMFEATGYLKRAYPRIPGDQKVPSEARALNTQTGKIAGLVARELSRYFLLFSKEVDNPPFDTDAPSKPATVLIARTVNLCVHRSYPSGQFKSSPGAPPRWN